MCANGLGKEPPPFFTLHVAEGMEDEREEDTGSKSAGGQLVRGLGHQ